MRRPLNDHSVRGRYCAHRRAGGQRFRGRRGHCLGVCHSGTVRQAFGEEDGDGSGRKIRSHAA